MTSRKKMPRACHDRATSLHFSIYAIANLYLYSVFINMRLAVVEQGAANPDYAREQKIRSAFDACSAQRINSTTLLVVAPSRGPSSCLAALPGPSEVLPAPSEALPAPSDQRRSQLPLIKGPTSYL